MTDSERLARIEEAVDITRDQVSEIHRALYGSNGMPGILTRVDRQERAWKVLAWVLGPATAALILKALSPLLR